MAGLSDLMQYTPTGSAVTEGMKIGADMNQSLASAQHARALAEESSAMLPYKLSEQAYEQDIRSRLDPNVMAQGKMGVANQQQALGQKAMFEFQQMPQEQQLKIKKEIEDRTNTFFNNFATQILEFGDRDSAAQAMIAADPSYEGIIGNLRKDPNLWNRFTPENAQKRLEANPEFLRAKMTANAPKAPGSINAQELYMLAAKGDPYAIKAVELMQAAQNQSSTQQFFDAENNLLFTQKTLKGLIDGGGGKPAAKPGPGTAAPSEGSLPKGAVAKAPAGMKEGAYRDANGKPFAVIGGFIYPPNK